MRKKYGPRFLKFSQGAEKWVFFWAKLAQESKQKYTRAVGIYKKSLYAKFQPSSFKTEGGVWDIDIISIDRGSLPTL